MKVLTLGACGFVGKYLKQELEKNEHTVHTIDIQGNPDFMLDLLDADKVYAHLAAHRYDAVVHLAGFSSVQRSWEMPRRTLELNVFTTLNLLEGIEKTGLPTRALLIGSSDQYGVVPQDKCMVRETDECHPKSPYAISKQTQEAMALALAAGRKLDVVMTRSFNHIGPGQRKGFAVSDFASAIAEIREGDEHAIYVGNTDVYRDFSDVRDVARAYRLLLEKGRSGEIYNVGSGSVHSIQTILETLIHLSGKKIEVRLDPAKFRPVDLVKIGCINEKLRVQTGWTPEIPMHKSIVDTLAWWNEQTDARA